MIRTYLKIGFTASSGRPAVIARSAATRQSSDIKAFFYWIASLRSQ